MKKQETSIADVLRYLDKIASNPKEKVRFNRDMKRAAEKERKRSGGEFSALFMDAVRIP